MKLPWQQVSEEGVVLWPKFSFSADSSDSHDHVQVFPDSFIQLTHPNPDSTPDAYWSLSDLTHCLLITIWSDSFAYWCSLSLLTDTYSVAYWWSTKLADSWLAPLYIKQAIGYLVAPSLTWLLSCFQYSVWQLSEGVLSLKALLTLKPLSHLERQASQIFRLER